MKSNTNFLKFICDLSNFDSNEIIKLFENKLLMTIMNILNVKLFFKNLNLNFYFKFFMLICICKTHFYFLKIKIIRLINPFDVKIVYFD